MFDPEKMYAQVMHSFNYKHKGRAAAAGKGKGGPVTRPLLPAAPPCGLRGQRAAGQRQEQGVRAGPARRRAGEVAVAVAHEAEGVAGAPAVLGLARPQPHDRHDLQHPQQAHARLDDEAARRPLRPREQAAPPRSGGRRVRYPLPAHGFQAALQQQGVRLRQRRPTQRAGGTTLCTAAAGTVRSATARSSTSAPRTCRVGKGR